jgi:hypothetical protein
MKTYGGMEVSDQLNAPAALPPGITPLDRSLGEPQSRPARCGEVKNLAPARIRTPAFQPVALRYPDSYIVRSVILIIISRFFYGCRIPCSYSS